MAGKAVAAPAYEKPIICSISNALTIIGGKWSFLVIKELFEEKKRFGELQKLVPKVTPKALTDTLRHLEKHGVVTRTVIPTVPVTVEYELTEKGHDLKKMIWEMKIWGSKWTS